MVEMQEAQVQEKIEKAARQISSAQTLIITAGAGMGVDSGLPDFRGTEGFWQAYPLYEKLGLNFSQMATPQHLTNDPTFGWGFYGHRTNLYRETVPHEGFGILLDWIKRSNLDYHVVTSNVDGQFQKAGFDEDRIVEIHGSIHHLQCCEPCKPVLWKNEHKFEIDFETMRAASYPLCKFCGETARPNVLMFGDFQWLPERSNNQERRHVACRHSIEHLAIIELGAGKAIPSIRWRGEQMARNNPGSLIRINPREPQVPSGQISIPLTALEALRRIDAKLKS